MVDHFERSIRRYRKVLLCLCITVRKDPGGTIPLVSSDFNPNLSVLFKPCTIVCFDFGLRTGFPRRTLFLFWYIYVLFGLRELSNDRHRQSVVHLHNGQAELDSFHMSIAEVTPEYYVGG